jgi:uncharacterized protein DUF4214/methyltransferase family protein
MRRFFRRLAEGLGAAFQSDTVFLEGAYREILGREVDQDGLNYYGALLRDGTSRTAVLLSLVRSEESLSKLRPKEAALPDLRPRRPDRYQQAVDRTTGQAIVIFEVGSPSDYDWLEAEIVQNGYYEQPGVWNLGVDVDKRVMAEIVAAFEPERALEVGCAAGAVIECLENLGIRAEGIEISSMAVARASPGVRPRIRAGDLLTLDLPASYDMVFGLDVFEHLNPNRIDAYAGRLAAITRSGGYLFCNIPAFGADPIFGTVFPLYLERWEEDAAAGRLFSTIHVDDLGYPLHGHLIWADTAWWASRFEAQALRREVEIERALHRKYDGYMDKRSRARKAYYVFSKDGDPRRARDVIERIRAKASQALS